MLPVGRVSKKKKNEKLIIGEICVGGKDCTVLLQIIKESGQSTLDAVVLSFIMQCKSKDFYFIIW